MNKDPNNDDKSKEYRKREHVSFGLGKENFHSHDHNFVWKIITPFRM